MNNITTCLSFPELVDELRSAKQRGARLVSAAPDPQLGQAVGFKLSDGAVFRLTLARIKEFEAEKGAQPQLAGLWNLISSTEGRIKLYLSC
jgi:hypothetical protein